MNDSLLTSSERFGEEAVDGADEATDLVTRFLKALKGYRLYLPNNQILRGFVTSFTEGLETFLERFGDLCLNVAQFRISYEGCPVYVNDVKEESLAFRFFIHGVREITFHNGVPEDELTSFLAILHRAFDSKTSVDDLLTLLWERDFQYITFIILDDFFEEGDQAEYEEFIANGQRVDHATATAHLSAEPVMDRMRSRDSGEPDSDLPSMALSDEERTRLAGWVEEEKGLDLPGALLEVVVEILAGIEDPKDGVEILGVLSRLLDNLLEENRIREALRILAELKALGRSEKGPMSDLIDHAIVRVDDGRLLAAVIPYLATSPVAERGWVIEFLISHVPSAVTRIFDHLADPELRDTALMVLAELAEDQMSTIVAGLDDPRPDVVAGLTRLIGEVGDLSCLSHLRTPLRHPDHTVRRETIRAIEKLKSPAAVSILSEVLDDPAPEIRVAAVRALASIPSDRVRGPLFKLARSRDFAKRTLLEKKEVYLALGRLKDPEIESWLISVLKRRPLFGRELQDEMRACAVAALARIGSEPAMAAIRARERDKSPQVVRAVQQVLSGQN